LDATTPDLTVIQVKYEKLLAIWQSESMVYFIGSKGQEKDNERAA
jgi:hypothetical protein